MYVLTKAVVRSRNYCCIENIMHSVRVVELHVTVSYIKILSSTQQSSCDKFVTGSNKTYVCLCVKRTMLHRN